MEHCIIARDIILDDRTLSRFYVDGERVGYTLEDQIRPSGVYVYGQTAIPAGEYELTVTYSNRFKKPMPLLLNVQGAKDLILFGDRSIDICGIRIHGGNVPADTLGCPLLGKDRNNIKVWNCATINKWFLKELQKSIKLNKVYLTVNYPPTA